MSDPAPKICATCGGPLDFLEERDEPEGRYVHAREEFGQRTHVVLPVDPSEVSEISNRCDFCFADGTMNWSVITHPFKTEHIVINDSGRPESYVQNYSSIWAACDDCADLIRRRRYSALVNRVLDAYQQREKFTGGPARTILKSSLKHLYALVEIHFVAVRPASPKDHTDQIHVPDSEG